MAGKSVLFDSGYSYVFGRVPHTPVSVVDGKLFVYKQECPDAKLRKEIGPFQVWARPVGSTAVWLVLDTRTGEVARVNRKNTLWADLLYRLEHIAARDTTPIPSETL